MAEQLYKKILLPTDGSKYADKSEKHALSIAAAYNAEIIALSVVENTVPVNLTGKETVAEINQLLESETLSNLKKVEDLRDEQGLDIKITPKIAKGSPAKAILAVAEEEDVDLIVIGSSGKSGIDLLLLGSVADKVVRSAKCSVLVVH
ncbi:universal stress protein [Methanobrevibacter sp.]|uniref:universal stress protein n=1 Tax=Methanobrevibacter sp. TaxID=66852 RepID=UPI0038901536